MRVPGAKCGRVSFGWLRSRFRRRGLILLYHRIAAPDVDPVADAFGLCLSPEDFAEQLETLRAHANPVSLAELCAHAQADTLPDRSVAITFDDGYVDLVDTARPLLERFEIPATVFVVTGGLGRTFWWDDLTDAVIRAPTLPRELVLDLGTKRFRREIRAQGHRERRRLLRTVHRLLRESGDGRVEAIVRQVVEWSGVEPRDTGVRRALTADEITILADSGLFTIGAHSVHHSCLARLEPAAQRQEIEDSRAVLEEAIHRPVKTFSYPFGTSADFSATTVEQLRRLGFESACTNIPGVVTRATDPLLLPRFWAPAGGGTKLVRILERWLAHGYTV